jgi:prepilin-type N-terminal cleavage/methylation domain-containing protein
MLMKKKGFTLVELLIVIAIISVLVVMVLIAIDPLRVIRESRDSKDRSELNGVKAALQLYFNEHNAYPATLGPLAPDYIRTVPNGINYVPAGTDYTASIAVSHVITADNESGARCGGDSGQGIGDAGTFYICAD